jgi:hypothetical protein
MPLKSELTNLNRSPAERPAKRTDSACPIARVDFRASDV